jgi:hypothetical protein
VDSPATAATGPIEDTSYAAGLPGLLARIMQNGLLWERFKKQPKLRYGIRAWASSQFPEDDQPLHTLGLGYVDFARGYDIGLAGLLGERTGCSASFRIVTFSPGRSDMVDALTKFEEHVIASGGPGPSTSLSQDAVKPAQAFRRWSELPRLSVIGGWTTMSRTGDRGHLGLAAGWLRPLGSDRARVPSGLDMSVVVPYVRYRASGSEPTSAFDPTFGLTWRDSVFRRTDDKGTVSTWRVQVGATLGVRNSLNAHAPLGAFIRLKFSPRATAEVTPAEFARQTTVLTLMARRNSDQAWVYGLHLSWLGLAGGSRRPDAESPGH